MVEASRREWHPLLKAGVFRSIPSRSRRRACSPTGSRHRALATGLARSRPNYTDLLGDTSNGTGRPAGRPSAIPSGRESKA
jgi:hypothetical protein